MNQYKRLLNNTFIFAIGTFSSKLLVFFMMRFYTGILAPDEMGVADLIMKTTNILYPIVSVSIGQAVIRYGLEKAHRKDEVFSIGIVTVLCGFLISLPFSPILNLVQYKTSSGGAHSLMPYAYLIYLYVLTSCLQNVCSQFIRAKGMVKLYAIDGIFRTMMTILFNILFLAVFEWSIFGYVFSVICADALSSVCLILIAKLWKFFSFRKLNTHLWRSMLQYALPLVPAAILVFVIGFSDQMFLARFRDTAESGIYSVSYKIPTLISLVASIFVDAWQISSINDNSHKEQVHFFSNVGNAYASIVFIVVSSGVMCSKLAMKLIAAPDYYIGWTFIPLLALGAGFSCLSSFQNSVYMLEKRTFPSFVSTAFSAVLNLTLNYIFIHPNLLNMGGNGAALATLISYFFLFLYRALDSRRFMPVRWKLPRLVITVALTSLQAALMLLEPPFWLIWQLLLFCLVFLINCKELLRGAKRVLHRA